VVENVCAITVVGVTEVDHCAQLPPLEFATTRDVSGIDTELRDRSRIEHQYAASLLRATTAAIERRSRTLNVSGTLEHVERRLHRHLVSFADAPRDLRR